MELQVGVKILLRNKEGKFLLGKRNPKIYPEVGEKWDIIGGRINPGINLLENLKREVKEETSLDLSGNPRLIAAQDILRVKGRHIVRLTYVGEIQGDPIPNEESLELKWFTMEKIRNLEALDIYIKELIDQGLI